MSSKLILSYIFQMLFPHTGQHERDDLQPTFSLNRVSRVERYYSVTQNIFNGYY